MRAAGNRLAPEAEPPRDRLPPGAAGAHAPVERVERRVGNGLREERDEDPDDRRDRDREQHDDRLDAEFLRAVARVRPGKRVLDQHEARHGDDHRREHRGDLAPRVDAPPVPTQDQDEARAASEREEEPPRALDRREIAA